MMKKIIGNSIGHDMENAKFPQNKDFCCTACATRKLILRPSYLKIRAEPLKFLGRIQGDICGPIQPLSGPFRYFMVLIDASTRWSHVSLLSTRNHAFAKIMADHKQALYSCKVEQQYLESFQCRLWCLLSPIILK